MKSILFVIPWSALLVNNTEYDFTEAPERAPENLVNLATYLQINGCKVRIADMSCILISCNGSIPACLSRLGDICTEFQPDVIGLSFFTARFEFAANIVSYLYNFYKNLSRPLFIAGGVHPTLLFQLTYDYIDFDALIIGEGEIPLLQLLQGTPLDKIKGIYLPNQRYITNADTISDLDELPFPNWDLIDKDFYTQPSHLISNARMDKVMPITFGRACMYRCNFCAHNSFLSARCHSPEYFIRMMQHVSMQCDVKSFLIQDSSIGNFKEQWKRVCKLLISVGSPYTWWANLRVNQVDEDFLVLMKDAGCVKLFFGFESGSQRILDSMNKHITVEQCINAASLCHKLDIRFYSSYIVNYFDETEEDLKATEQLIMITRPDSLAINKFSPIPGSVDYDKTKKKLEPLLTNMRSWTKLGMLLSPLLYGNMSEERFEWWYSYLKGLKKIINSNENN